MNDLLPIHAGWPKAELKALKDEKDAESDEDEGVSDEGIEEEAQRVIVPAPAQGVANDIPVLTQRPPVRPFS